MLTITPRDRGPDSRHGSFRVALIVGAMLALAAAAALLLL
jgi:hypothetical protein